MHRYVVPPHGPNVARVGIGTLDDQFGGKPTYGRTVIAEETARSWISAGAGAGIPSAFAS